MSEQIFGIDCYLPLLPDAKQVLKDTENEIRKDDEITQFWIDVLKHNKIELN